MAYDIDFLGILMTPSLKKTISENTIGNRIFH